MRKVLLAVFCLGLLGMSVHSWRCGPSDELANRLFRHEVPHGQYCVVNNEHSDVAINRLQRNAIIEIQKNEADYYILPCNVELKRFYYLVRALDVSGHDRFTVYGYDGNVYVTSGVLGISASPRRTALVLSTNFAVSHVYVSYFVAE